MTSQGNTLHFINRIDDTNCGDRIVCPLLYYFDFFKRYNIKRHDMRFIDFKSICPTDVVIIGGGGMFDYAEFTNRAINQVLESGATVIAWAPGFNTHTEYHGTFDTQIKFDRFELLTVRDFQNPYGIEYLPDVTCKLSQFYSKYEVCRKYGVARHKDYPILGLNFDTITNDSSVDEILKFIGETEVVVSNSFHMLYWSMLMGKRTICVNPFSSKFYSYKHKPQYYNTEIDDFTECVRNAPTYDILGESIFLNDVFFEKVKRIIESKLSPSLKIDTYKLITQLAIAEENYRDTQFLPGDLLASQLFIDLGNGWTEANKLIAINNVLGDAIHKVKFDISGFELIKKIRFDPIESRNCEVKILSAKTANGDIKLSAEQSVRVDTCDRFLTTDPQYIITSPCEGFIEIEFQLRTLTLFEAEQNIYDYSRHMVSEILNRDKQISQCDSKRDSAIVERDSAIAERDSAIAERDSAIAERDSAIAERDNAIAERDNAIAERDNAIAERASVIRAYNNLMNSTSWKMTAPIRGTWDFLKRILKGTR